MFWDARARETKRQWQQRVLPPMPEDARREYVRAENLATILNRRYRWFVMGMWITSIIAYIGWWIYAIATFGFFWGVGLGSLLTPVTAKLAAWLWPIALTVIPVVVVLLSFA
jgi:hypothetical protein